MLIYQNTTDKFIQDVRENVISDIMTANFREKLGKRPGDTEVASWQNSLSRVRDLVELAGLKDNRIALEYEVPYNQSRIDCLLFGKGTDSGENIVLIELKQWQKVIPEPAEGNYVETYTGGGSRVVAHPSQQIEGYHRYLKSFITEFDKEPTLTLFSCAYCHNYQRQENEGLFAPYFQKLMEDFPVYTKNDVKALAERIQGLLVKGDGFEIFNRFMRSPVRPSKKLLENVSRIIRNESVFSLLNEQLVAKNLIWSKIGRSKRQKTKSVIIVHGGPGTGKSLIALNVLAQAAKDGYKVFYGCKSKPFIEGLKNLVGRDGGLLFSNLYRFVPTKVKPDELDVLLVDEAHRIEKTSNFQFTKPEDRTEMPQVEQLIRCAQTAVFFIDDKQNVRSQEIGDSAMIRTTADAMKCTIDEVQLLTQYRCMGSNDYLLWLESVLGYSDEKRVLRRSEIFDFRIYDTPQKLYDALRTHEDEKANSARLVAGFCWPWSKTLDADGQMVRDVRIGDFAMPWETHGEISRPPKGYVKWYEWGYKPEGFKQVGCIYTAQGFEYDYIGVIIGDDLVFDETTQTLKADITATKDPTLKKNKIKFETHVKNIYRTLMSRGMKGCYVYFVNKKTEAYFRRFVEMETGAAADSKKDSKVYPFELISNPAPGLVPLYSLEAAAGGFSASQTVEALGWIQVPGPHNATPDHFVAHVVGKSMEPLIPDGSYCLFKKYTGGTREGKVVLTQCAGIHDPETGGSYTVKKYHSEKVAGEDGEWLHTKIELRPINKAFKTIAILSEGEGDVIVVAEYAGVLDQYGA